MFNVWIIWYLFKLAFLSSFILPQNLQDSFPSRNNPSRKEMKGIWSVVSRSRGSDLESSERNDRLPLITTDVLRNSRGLIPETNRRELQRTSRATCPPSPFGFTSNNRKHPDLQKKFEWGLLANTSSMLSQLIRFYRFESTTLNAALWARLSMNCLRAGARCGE